MKILGLITLFFAFASFSNSNYDNSNCNTYFPLEKGISWKMKSYSAKGKLEGTTFIKIVDAIAIDNGMKYIVEGEVNTEKKKEEPVPISFEYLCEGGVIKMDMSGMIPPEMTKGVNESMEVTMDQTELEIPKSLAVGDKLKDGKVVMTIKSNGTKIFDITVNITDRIVEKSESITTEAGTYDCLKMTYKTSMKMMFMNQNTSTTEWISSKVGIVKSEQFDKKGKLTSYSELSEYQRN